MGLFDKSEEAKKIDEEKKQLKQLENYLKSSGKLDASAYNVLINYLNEVRQSKRNNDFIDNDFLYRVFIEINDSEFKTSNIMMNQLADIIVVIHDLLPAGDKTPNYEFIKEVIINNFVSSNGYIHNKIYSQEFYSLFSNILDYLDVMNIISGDDNLISNFIVINKYANEVAKYCVSEEIFKNDLISFLYGFNSVVDNDYYNYVIDSIVEAKKRIGVYLIDQKTLTLVNSNVEKVEGYLDNIQEFKRGLEEERRGIESLVRISKEDLSKYSKKAISELKQALDTEKLSLFNKLDEYLLELESMLKDKSDAVFQEIIASYQKQIRDFKTTFQAYSRSTTQDLLKIQAATEESVSKLQDYVANDESLPEILAKAAESATIQARLVSIVEQGEQIMASAADNEQGKVIPTIIPPMDRIIVPATPEVIIPKEVAVDRKILPVFDESIPFDKRMNKILKTMKEKEQSGEIYHVMAEEIIRCIIEGDWPYLWGPSGCGKSYLMSQVSELLGLPLVKNGKITEPYTVMGYNDPQGKFRATQTYIAAKYGKLLVFDEFDNGNPDTQVVLNEIYTGLIETLEHPEKLQYVTFAEDMVTAIHPNFRMISAGNTTGAGESPVYSSRLKIDESVQQRMTPKFVNYDNRVEKNIFGKNNDWYNFFVSFRKACDDYARGQGLDSSIGIGTTRDAAAINKYIKNNSKSLDQVISEKFIQTKSQEYLEALGRYIANIYNIDYDRQDDVGTSKLQVDSKTIAKKFVYKCKRGIR